MKNSYVYILSNKRNGALYVGVTTDLIKRVYEHKTEKLDGFTKRYGIKNLVYYEVLEDIEEAIKREKVIKGWVRSKKIALIEQKNEEWLDLYENLLS